MKLAEIKQTGNLSIGESKNFQRIFKLLDEGRKKDKEACDCWVKLFDDERRHEIMSASPLHIKRKLEVMEGVGQGIILPALLWGTHRAVRILRSMPLIDQNLYFKEGIPTLRRSGRRIEVFHLSHEEMTTEDLLVAFASYGGNWRVRNNKEQKNFLLALAKKESPAPNTERGFGAFDEKRKVFIPAPGRSLSKTGFSLQELEDIVKRLKEL